MEPTLHFQHSQTAALFGWRLLPWLEEGQRAEEVRLYSLENLLSSHPPLLRDTGFNIAFLSYFFIQWKSCHFYFLLPKTQFILKICSIWSKNGMLPLKVMNKLIQLILFLILYHLCIHLDGGTWLWLKIYIYFTFISSFILHSF